MSAPYCRPKIPGGKIVGRPVDLHVAKAAVQPEVDLPLTKMASWTHALNASRQVSRGAVATRVVATAELR